MAKRKSVKTYAFIDTNIFLDFYRSQNETSLSLLKKLEGVKDNIICTYQVEMEFLKNRQKAIIASTDPINLNIDSRLPAVMDDSQLNSLLKKEKKNLESRKKELRKRIGNIISKPASYDPVYKSLEAIFTSENPHVLTRDMKERHEIKQRAWQRYTLGYPPRKADDTSMGDAVNWEWFISCAKSLKGKFIIVSRDSDFGISYDKKYYLNDGLKAEFRDRVGKKSITYTGKLSEALKALEVSVTPEEEDVEKSELIDMEQIDRQSIDDIYKSINNVSFSKVIDRQSAIVNRVGIKNIEAISRASSINPDFHRKIARLQSLLDKNKL